MMTMMYTIPIAIKHYVKVNIVSILFKLILKIFGTFFGRFVAPILFFRN
jgi:hypothetical protein